MAEAGRQALGDRRTRGGGGLEVATADEIGDQQEHQQWRQQRGEVTPARRSIGGGALFPSTHETQSAPEQEQTRRDREHHGDDQRKVIGLLDVLHHLGRVDEVIDRDEVEADAELFPEEDLGDLPEREEEGAEEPGRAQGQAQPAGGRPRSRPESPEQAQRKGQQPGHRQVEQQAEEEGDERRPAPGDLTGRGDKETDPQERAEQDIARREEQGASLTRT